MSQASRTPVKICRLIGWSQLRYEGRITGELAGDAVTLEGLGQLAVGA